MERGMVMVCGRNSWLMKDTVVGVHLEETRNFKDRIHRLNPKRRCFRIGGLHSVKATPGTSNGPDHVRSENGS
jgi:hypothetical protein